MSEQSKQLKAFQSRKLQEGEIVQSSMKGFPVSKTKSVDSILQGEIILTNERVCYYRKGVIGTEMESIPLEEIKSIETDATLGMRTLRLFSPHNSIDIMTYQRSVVFDSFTSAVQTAMRSAKPGQTASAPPAQSPTERLKSLTELHEAGHLTESEYEIKKSEILSQL